MDRRSFLKASLGLTLVGSGLSAANNLFAARKKKKPVKWRTSRAEPIKTNESVFDDIIKTAKTHSWETYSIGALMGLIAQKFYGTPYVAGTLDINDMQESCVVNFLELDCVTFYETVLTLARIIKKGKTSIDDYIQELTFIRYRKGHLDDYTSRLHYTSDWIFDNVKKDVVDDITSIIGGEPIKYDVFFMSENSELYPTLRKIPKMIAEIESYEDSIGKRTYYYIPNDKVASLSDRIQTGDIICIVTNKQGLDYSHTGLAVVENGAVRFCHASSKAKKVLLDVTIDQYLEGNSSSKGISVFVPKKSCSQKWLI